MLNAVSFILTIIIGILFVSLSRVYSNTAFVLRLDFLVIKDYKLVFLLMCLASLGLAGVFGIPLLREKRVITLVSGLMSVLSLLLWALYCFVMFLLYEAMFMRLEYGIDTAKAFLMVLPQLLLIFVLLSFGFGLIVKTMSCGKVNIILISLTVLSTLVILLYCAGFIWFLSNMLPGVYYVCMVFLFALIAVTNLYAGICGSDKTE